MQRRDILSYPVRTGPLLTGTNYVVQANNGSIYAFGIGLAQTGALTNQVYYIKSLDNGITWSAPVLIQTGLLGSQISIWYDRWSGLSSDYIHVAYTDETLDDCFYRNINTASGDALSAQTTIFLGASTASRPWMSISVARGGNIYCLVMIDGGTEETFVRSTDNGATWTTRTLPFNIPQFGTWVLLPSWNADNQDMMLIYLTDNSTNPLWRFLYDDSADTWDAGTNILTGLVAVAFSSVYKFSATVDLANNRNIISVWNRFNFATAVLKCYTVTETTITAVTDVVASSGGNQALTCISLNTDTNTWYVFYAGTEAGTDTYLTSMKLYYKFSTDSGTTWSTERLLSDSNYSYDLTGISFTCTPRFTNNFYCFFQKLELSVRYSTINSPFPLLGGTITAG